MNADTFNSQNIGTKWDRSHNQAMEELAGIIAERQTLFHRIALRYLGNLPDAEDAVQDAFLSAVRHLKQFKREAPLSTWLTAIVTNSARMKLRQRSRFLQTFLNHEAEEGQECAPAERLADCHPNPEELCQVRERAQIVIGMAAQLSPVLRNAFRLRQLGGLSVREVARILDVPPGTIKARTVRARARLQKMAKERGILKDKAAIELPLPTA